MAKCLMCGTELVSRLSLAWLLSLQPLILPVLCPQCQRQFSPLAQQTTCPGCGRAQLTTKLCQDCQRWQKMGETELLANQALYGYNTAMKDYVQRYKFTGDYQWRLIFQREFTAAVQQFVVQEWLVVPIPVDQQTFEVRGFNQVLGLLDRVPTANLLQFKQQSGRIKQSTKTRKNRMETTQPFAYCGRQKLSGQKILLIDDIYTTGRTLYHAKHVLAKQGASQVRSLTLAR